MPWLLKHKETGKFMWPGGFTAHAPSALRFTYKDAADEYLRGLPAGNGADFEPALVALNDLNADRPGALPSYDPSGLRARRG